VAKKKEQLVRCLVTGKEIPFQDAVRFVWSPDIGKVVPDLKRELDGDEVWLSISDEIFERALSQRLFDKVFIPGVDTSMATAMYVKTLLKKRCLETLMLANKAGALVFGAQKLQAVIAKSKVFTILQAVDAQESGAMQLSAGEIPVYHVFMRHELGAIFARDNVVYVGVIQEHFAKLFHERVKRLQMFG
jgi:predicted RNA-binding protein YlxR (DUF448 family)